MNKNISKLELEKVLQRDAAEIVAAREKAILIHHTKDINAAGDEVEQTVRKVLRRKLPANYYIGHGHITDSTLATSSQFDVVIADTAGSPILFQTENGTSYFPYESVYAVGEVKSSYYADKKYIHKFVDDLAQLKSNLYREKILSNYIGHGVELGAGFGTDIKEPFLRDKNWGQNCRIGG